MQTCSVRLRHLNSGRLLRVKLIGKKEGNKLKKTCVLTLGRNITAKDVNDRLRGIEEIEHRNRYNSNFNSLTDPVIQNLQAGVGPEYIFEIENSIVDVQNRVKNNTVAKIINIKYGLTISTDIKKMDGEDANEDEDGEEFEQSSYQGTKSSLFDDGNISPDDFSDDEAHTVDEHIYTPMMYDESEQIRINNIKLIKNGSMDDVFIFEKVMIDEYRSLLFIQSCVPKIKEFS